VSLRRHAADPRSAAGSSGIISKDDTAMVFGRTVGHLTVLPGLPAQPR